MKKMLTGAMAGFGLGLVAAKLWKHIATDRRLKGIHDSGVDEKDFCEYCYGCSPFHDECMYGSHMANDSSGHEDTDEDFPCGYIVIIKDANGKMRSCALPLDDIMEDLFSRTGKENEEGKDNNGEDYEKEFNEVSRLIHESFAEDEETVHAQASKKAAKGQKTSG